MSDPSDPLKILDTPELQAAFRAAQAYYLDPGTDRVPATINPCAHCIYVQVHPDRVTIGVVEIASLLHRLPPPCADEIKHHASRRILVHVFEDMDRGLIKLVHASLQKLTMSPGGDAE